MDKKDLKKLRMNLPPNGKKMLAEQFGLSPGHITQILLGNRNNVLVLIAAAKLAYEHKTELDEASKFIQSL